MIRNNGSTIHYPIFDKYCREIQCFTSTRFGGVSAGNYSSFNLGLYSGDSEKNIAHNFAHLRDVEGLSDNPIFLPFQTHGNSVRNIDSAFLSLSNSQQQEALHGVDALITNLPNVCIGVSTADCVPVLLFDPQKKVIAAIHAGWRGTCARIVQHAISAMSQHYSINPRNLIALIGPSISAEVYEVGEDLLDMFKQENFNTDAIFLHKGGKLYLDLWLANKLLFEEGGGLPENIEISGICTYLSSEQFFSARRLGIQSGRIVTGIMLK